MKSIKRCAYILSAALLVVVFQLILSINVHAESENSTITTQGVISDSSIINAHNDQVASIVNDSSFSDSSNSASTVGSSDTSNISPSSIIDKNEEDNFKKNSGFIDIASVILGGVIAIAGTIVSSFFASREASKQREFQLKIEKIEREADYRKELALYKRNTYTDFVIALIDLNRFLANSFPKKGQDNTEEFDKYHSNISENYSKIKIIGSRSVITKAETIFNGIHSGMKSISKSDISDLASLMRNDIEQELSQSIQNEHNAQ